ncbi:hypothetical protein ACSZN3_08100 [Aeromonas hydrophila]|uniref:hypothetical protein n=1 Tax=Aeromonas hydrophila TaxID=644 RepID=UPI002F408376
MPFFMQSYLAPIPSVVLDNYQKYLAPLKNQGKRIVFAPHCELVFNLVYRGYFCHFTVLGALDRNSNKIGRTGNGIFAYSYDFLTELKPDIVVVANTRYHNEIMAALRTTAEALNFKLVDLCSGYEHAAFRQELAEFLDCRKISQLRPGCVDVPATITDADVMAIEIVIETGWGLGDKLCALSAAREFARRNPNLSVYYNTLPKIVAAYGDELLKLGTGAYPLPENYALFHREKDSSPAANYLGCYYLGLGINFYSNPKLELPAVPPCVGLMPDSYIALQPTANWATPNISLDDIKRVIQDAPLPVVLTGNYITNNSTDNVSDEDKLRFNQELVTAGANASYIGDEMNMLKLIRHAALVLTPRSASAHIAAGYGVKTVVWVPNDGENWHLDYPNWQHKRISAAQEHVGDELIREMHNLIKKK